MADGIEFPVSVPVTSTGSEAAVAQLNSVAAAAVNAESSAGKLAGTSTSAASGVSSFGTAASSASGGAAKLTGGVQQLDPTLKKALGPMGESIERLNAMKASFGAGGIAAIGIGAAWLVAATALVALGTAAVTATWQLAKFALQSNKAAWDRMTKATAKLEGNFGKLMSRVRVDKFVSAWEDVLSVFDEGSSTANALSTLFGAILNPLFDAAARVLPYLKEAFKGVVWAAMQLAIAAIKVGQFMWSLVPDGAKDAIKELTSGIDWMATAFWAGVIVAGVLATAVGLLALVVGVVAVAAVVALGIALLFMALPILVSIVVIGLLIAAVLAIGYAVYEAVSALMDLGAAGLDAAGELINGLVNGITSGAGAVYDALRQMASQMGATIKSALGIASPSKLFAAFGENTALGFAVGVEAETPTVNSAVESMVSEPDMDGASAGSGGSGGGVITLRFVGPDGRTQDRRVRPGETLMLALEDLALALGAGEVPA